MLGEVMIEPRHSELLRRDWLSLSTVNTFGKHKYKLLSTL
jgi:hypothetical protein